MLAFSSLLTARSDSVTFSADTPNDNVIIFLPVRRCHSSLDPGVCTPVVNDADDPV